MTIQTIENDIISQLQANITELKIEGFPENSSKYTLLHPKGAILVHFKGSSYEKPEEKSFIQQVSALNFGLTLIIKGLRDKDGAYSYIDTVISALTGYTPTGCGKMYPIDTDFLKEEDGLWKYSLNFTVPTENFST